MTTIYANFNSNTDSAIAKPRLSLSNHTTPRGIAICETEHYTAFELADEESEGGFTAVVHAKRSNGRHTENVTRYCFVRSMVASQLETLEKYKAARHVS